MTLRHKILVILFAIGLLTVGVFVFVVQPRMVEAVDQVITRQTEQELETVAESLVPLLIQNQFAGIHENLDALINRHPAWVKVELFDQNNRRLYPLSDPPDVQSPDIENFSNPIEFRGSTLGHISVSVDFTSDRSKVKESTFTFVAAISAIFSMAIFLVGILLEMLISNRLQTLSNAANRLAQQDYTTDLSSDSKDEIGILTRSFSVMRDAVRDNAATLEAARLEADSANVAKSLFLATMSHEIRTPINGILGMTQMLMLENLSEAERNDYVRTILKSGESLLNIVNDILDLSKVEAGKLRLEMASVSMAQVIQDTIILHSDSAKQKDLSLTGKWLGPDISYEADPLRLRQMLSNFVSNAIKFSNHGEIQIEGRQVQTDEETVLLEFSVSDNGIGIPQEKHDILFKTFSQADMSNTRNFGGTGLGLSIVKNLANLMGGDVGCQSEPGKGSRFWFTVKATQINQACLSEDTKGPEVVLGSVDHHSKRVLVVEDNPINCKVITAMLKRSGVEVIFAEDGQQAVDAIEGGANPDLIFMDCQMPVMDGLEASKAIRTWESFNQRPRIPIIALTASAFAEDRVHAINAGMDDFFTKPIRLENIAEVLDRWLDAMPNDAANKVH